MTTDDYEYDYNGIDKTEIYAIVLGIISGLLSLSVVFILLFKYEKLLKDRPLIHYVFMIAISDTFVSITTAIGYPAAVYFLLSSLLSLP